MSNIMANRVNDFIMTENAPRERKKRSRLIRYEYTRIFVNNAHMKLPQWHLLNSIRNLILSFSQFLFENW